MDSFLLSSPYASSFGGFVEIATLYWWAAGGVVSSLYDTLQERLQGGGAQDPNALPSDMSTMSLVGGGLIAGDSLAALAVGIAGLLQTVL